MHFERHSLGKLVEDLTHRRLKETHSVHFDPDLRRAALKRAAGWRPIFSQAGAAETHLRNYGVTVGDLFLFFGWFREAELHEGCYRYKRGAANRHVLYGWLQVGAILTFSERRFAKVPWAEYHPHFYGAFGTVYLARDRLWTRGRTYDLPAGDVFSRYHDSLRLTAPKSKSRGIWQVPKWFYSRNGKSPLSYHPDLAAFEKHRNHTILHSTARGQEFILDTTEYPDAITWARRLIANAA